MERALRSTLSLLWLLGACQHADSGAGRSFRVRDGQFFQGELPGMMALDGSDSLAADSGASGPPRITSLETSNLDVFQGQGNKAFRGRASNDASSVAIALDGVDKAAGYWVVPMGAPDPSTDELTWNVVTDFGFDVSPGKHTLRSVAIDGAGRAGEQLVVTLCIDPLVPDNGHACHPDRPAPRAVISLAWSENADLDLQVVEPGGRVVDSQHPSDDAAADGGSNNAATIDRDSNPGCAIDGLRREDMVWNADPVEGPYDIFANLFDACKQPAIHFQVTVYTADADGNMTQRLAQGGELLDIAADPKADRGLYVATFNFNPPAE